MSNKKLGPYEILGVLGRGGMGTVFKARHESTGEVVAVKALSNSASDETHFRQRFESEIQALLKLNHPNIVRILSFGQERGTLFFAMELVEGKSLFHLQRDVKKFDWREVLRIARDVASALRHAHDRGIIHRDMKPGNLMQSKSGLIKVADFGIAKSFGANNDTRDNVIGTLDFMSPEQAAGKPVTVRSDLYSLGAVLYTLLSGQPPFAANSIEESLRNLTRVPAQPIREKVPNVPEPLEMLIAELLEKKPENRTPTAFALLRKLDYVEQVLRVNSEAKTSAGESEKAGEPKESFLLGAPENNLAQTNAGGQTNPKSKPASPPPTRATAKTRAIQETVVQRGDDQAAPGDDELQLAEPEIKPDYFKTVTDKTREAYTSLGAPVEHKTGIGWFPIFLLLVGLVAAGGYGTYLVTRPPTAQKLYESIEKGATNPTAVLDEINQFLNLYPEDERVPQIKELERVAKVDAFHKRLVVRNRVPGESRLSTIEQKFVSVMDEIRSNAAIGLPQLEAFVTLYDAGEATPHENVEVVEAAKTMLKKVRDDAKKEVVWSRKQINEALDRAETSPDKAASIYEAIIKSYEKTEFAQDLVELARERLANLDR